MKRKAGSFIRVSEKGYTYEEIVVADDLKQKVDRPEGIPAQAVLVAEQAVERLQGEFLTWVTRDVGNLGALCDKLVATGPDEEREQTRHQIRVIAHDLRGQGATFGYPLITDLATCLGTIMRLEAPSAEMQRDMAKRLTAMMSDIVERRIGGDGGSIGEEMRKEAHRMAVLAADPARGGPAIPTT